MRVACSFILSASLLSPSYAQSPAQAAPESQNKQAVQQPEPVSLKQPLAFGLEDGTPIKLRLTRNLTSADATTGDRVDFEVLEEVKVKDVIVVPRGGLALATITEAEHKRRMARGGKLNVNIDDVRLTDGEKAPLRAVKEAKGGGHTGAMTGAIVATAILFFPAAPFFLFMHGKDITIPKGTEITAYINGDIPLDPTKFQASVIAKPVGTEAAPQMSVPATAISQPAMPQPVPALVIVDPPQQSLGDAARKFREKTAPNQQPMNGADQPVLSSVEVKCNPDGAEITVDNKYVGSTPSTLKLTAGDHKIKLEKSGFKTWQRTLTVSVGASVTVNATLDKE